MLCSNCGIKITATLLFRNTCYQASFARLTDIVADMGSTAQLIAQVVPQHEQGATGGDSDDDVRHSLFLTSNTITGINNLSVSVSVG